MKSEGVQVTVQLQKFKILFVSINLCLQSQLILIAAWESRFICPQVFHFFQYHVHTSTVYEQRLMGSEQRSNEMLA